MLRTCPILKRTQNPTILCFTKNIILAAILKSQPTTKHETYPISLVFIEHLQILFTSSANYLYSFFAICFDIDFLFFYYSRFIWDVIKLI